MIYKRCKHKGNDKEMEKCLHPWYASYQATGKKRAKLALSKWTGKTIRGKKAAMEAYDSLKAELRAGTFNPHGRGVADAVPGKSPTLAALIASFKSDHVIAKRQKGAGDYPYRVKSILEYFGPNTPIHTITDARAEAFQASLRQPRIMKGSPDLRLPSPATANRPAAMLQTLLAWAKSRKLIVAHPTLKFKREDYSRWRRVFAPEEVLLLNAASPQLRALIVLALDTGLRQGEMLKLRCCDIDFDAGTIVPQGNTTKNDKHRVIPMASQRVRKTLAWLMIGKLPLAPLIDEDGNSVNDISRGWETCRLKAHGFPVLRNSMGNLTRQSQQAIHDIGLVWHDLRHEFACRLDDRGVALGVIQQLLGHADIKTTERYLRRGARELQAGALKLDDGSLIEVDLPGLKSGRGVAKCPKVSQSENSPSVSVTEHEG